jgi:hypothetical protein
MHLIQVMWISNYTDQSDKSTGELSNKITTCRIRKRARIQATNEQYKTNNTHYGCNVFLIIPLGVHNAVVDYIKSHNLWMPSIELFKIEILVITDVSISTIYQ